MLTAEQIREIRYRRKQGETHRAIARATGHSTYTVHVYLNKKREFPKCEECNRTYVGKYCRICKVKKLVAAQRAQWC